MKFLICQVCEQYKPHKAKGLCVNCYAKRIRELNKDKINSKRREHYKNNIEEMRERNKENYQKHHEQRLRHQKDYYITHLEEHKERGKKYRENHREELLEYLRQYKIDNPEKIKGYDYKKSSRKWREKNKDKEEFKEKHRKEAKIYRENNPEKVKETFKKWRLNNPDKAKMGGVRYRSNLKKCTINDLSSEQWSKIKEFFGYKCAYCGVEEKDIKNKKNKLTIDHVIPISKGGNNTANNVVPACMSCNARKRDRLIEPNYPDNYEKFLKQIEIPNLDVVGL